MPSLGETVLTFKGIGACPPAREIKYALTHAHSFGVNLNKYSDKKEPGKAGRVIMHLGDAVKNDCFQAMCPVLCSLYGAYWRNCKSFCFMVSLTVSHTRHHSFMRPSLPLAAPPAHLSPILLAHAPLNLSVADHLGERALAALRPARARLGCAG